jgi:hypothetical protein
MHKMLKMRLNGLPTLRNIASTTSPKSHFKTFRRQIMSSQGHSPNLNVTSDFIQIDFFDAENSENNFDWPFDTPKIASSTLPKSFLRLPFGRLNVLRPICLLKS